MHQPFKTAREVSEHVLAQTGAATLAGDFGDFAKWFALPATVETYTGQCELTSIEELRAVFDGVQDHMKANGVTEMVRHCIEAEFKDVHTVLATHETRMVSHAILIQKPFPALSVLKFDGVRWRIHRCCYAIEDNIQHNDALLSAGTRRPPRHSRRSPG